MNPDLLDSVAASALRPVRLAREDLRGAARRRGLRHRRLEPLFIGLTVLLDVWLVTAGFLLAYWVYFASGLFEHSGAPTFRAYYLPIPLIVFLWMIVAPSFDLHGMPRGFSWTKTIVQVVQAAGVGGVLTMAMTFMYRGFSYSRATLVLGWVLAAALVSVERLLAWELLCALRERGLALTRTAIIGLARPGRDIVRNMKQYAEMGYDMLGFIPDRPGDEDRLAAQGVPCLGKLADVKDLVRRYDIELLLIAVPHSEREKILDLVSECDLERVDLRIASTVLDVITRPVGIEEVAGIPLLGLREHPLTTWRGWVKRWIDLLGSLAGLAIVAPALALVAVLVKLTSKGPILFGQVRVGHDDKPFVMYKFRTMRADAEVETGPVFAQEDDPRYTPIGGFLRKTSLDELPQLFNVLKGEMSLVGPRPERPEFVEQFQQSIPRYLRRHRVKGGITGWAQVHGLRGRTSIEERIEHDLYYITRWSLGLDFVILLKTIRAVFHGENAC
jgi:exopolysaccharide biosynthesis polyprenyl glycosylphosphotransferase